MGWRSLEERSIGSPSMNCSESSKISLGVADASAAAGCTTGRVSRALGAREKLPPGSVRLETPSGSAVSVGSDRRAGVTAGAAGSATRSRDSWGGAAAVLRESSGASLGP